MGTKITDSFGCMYDDNDMYFVAFYKAQIITQNAHKYKNVIKWGFAMPRKLRHKTLFETRKLVNIKNVKHKKAPKLCSKI